MPPLRIYHPHLSSRVKGEVSLLLRPYELPEMGRRKKAKTVESDKLTGLWVWGAYRKETDLTEKEFCKKKEMFPRPEVSKKERNFFLAGARLQPPPSPRTIHERVFFFLAIN